MSTRSIQRANLIHLGRAAYALYMRNTTANDAAKILGKSRQTVWRACKAFAEAHPGEAERMLAESHNAPVPSVTALERDPLLDGWEPESVTPVTDSDIDELLA